MQYKIIYRQVTFSNIGYKTKCITSCPGPPGRTEATCIVSDWVSQVEEENKHKQQQQVWGHNTF